MKEDKHPYSTGTLVTVANAHPDHKQWYGFIIDRIFSYHSNKVPKHWNKEYRISDRGLAPNRWYYAICGSSFINKNEDKLIIEIFIDSNIKKASYK